jgi:glycerol-3-phosphate dehydrogenase
MKIQTEVLIAGGGATGVGIARDLSLRGIPSLLIEKGDLLSGASGRNHGLFHSGGRYAVYDPEAGRECIAENKVLRRIALQCIEETDGLFVSLPEDGDKFRDRFLRACEEVGIPAILLSRDETLSLEPELNPNLLSAVKVPDGAVDPFKLVLENARDAETHGAKFLLHTEITSLSLDRNKVKRAMAIDLHYGEEYSIDASYLINATGAWANHFLKLVGLEISMALSKGSMLITNQRLNQRVINRCRPPSDGDIIVPNETVSIIGTTSVRSEEVENFEVTPPEVSLLVKEATKMIPAVRESRFIRAYAGIRPLFQSEEKEEDRAISRGFILIDHEKRDGLKNLITIIGGKLVTYRLMAEKASDLICQKMGIDVAGSTHLSPLPGSHGHLRLRDYLKKTDPSGSADRGEILCDCELIERKEVENILKEGKLQDLQDMLHRTRLAKGTCQGGFCIYRLLGVLTDLKRTEGDPKRILKEFLEERWKGIHPVLWGPSMSEGELIESIYKGIFNL